MKKQKNKYEVKKGERKGFSKQMVITQKVIRNGRYIWVIRRYPSFESHEFIIDNGEMFMRRFLNVIIDHEGNIIDVFPPEWGFVDEEDLKEKTITYTYEKDEKGKIHLERKEE